MFTKIFNSYYYFTLGDVFSQRTMGPFLLLLNLPNTLKNIAFKKEWNEVSCYLQHLGVTGEGDESPQLLTCGHWFGKCTETTFQKYLSGKPVLFDIPRCKVINLKCI